MSALSHTNVAWSIAWILLLSGCAMSPAGREIVLSDPEQAKPAEQTPAEATSAPESATMTSPQAAPPQTIADKAADPAKSAEAAELVATLQTLRALSPAEQDQLVKDLAQTDPQLWPLVTQQFRASLDYRQRQMQPGSAAPVPLPGKVAANSPATELAVATLPKAPAAMPPRAVSLAAHEVPASNSAPPSPPVTMAIKEPTPLQSPVDWQQPLQATIGSLEESLRHLPGTDDRQIYLRLLYLMSGQRDKLLSPLAGREPAEQEFWSKEMYGLSLLLDATRQPDRGKRATEAAIQLGEAQLKLGQAGLLVIRNLTFCTEVSSYGVHKRFEKTEFRPEQRFVLYAEVENFVSEATPQGHHTALRASYQIFDNRGTKVEERELPTMEEHCQNPRRDFFVAYSDLRLPKQIYDGRYTLKLSIEDTLGKKIGQSAIDFTVKNSSTPLAAQLPF